MALVFCDSFDTTSTFPGGKWSEGVSSFSNSPVRTGVQSLHPYSAGFNSLPRLNFANRSCMIAGFAWYASGSLAAVNICGFYNNTWGGFYVSLQPNAEGQIAVYIGPYNIVTSAPGVLTVDAWNYIEVYANMVSEADGGLVIVRVNGNEVINQTGSWYGGPGYPTGADWFTLTGSSAVDVYYDDFYLLDDTGTYNNTFLGAVDIQAVFPDANKTPLNWTPLANTNYQEVNQFPPPGDSAYVSDFNTGAIDQYHYTPGAGSYLIFGVQHSLMCDLDSTGSHTVASQVNANTGPEPQVGNNTPTEGTYNYVITPYDTNPNTSEPFKISDFATTYFGPTITS